MKHMLQPAVIKVLLIEDDPEDVLLVRDMFWWEDADRFNLIRVGTLDEAVARARTEAFDILLFDMTLPGAAGLAGLAKAQAALPGLPVVALGVQGDEGTALAALDAGAEDYLIKAPGNAISLARMRQAMERNRVQAHVADQTRRDAVTGLSDRHAFRDRIERALADGAPFALVLLDLDRFKAINDSLGHQAGDKLLAAVAARLEWHTRTRDEVGRLGDDEFALLLADVADHDQARAAAQEILAVISRPFQVGRHEFYVSASLGVVCSADGPADAGALLKNAESALAKAKGHGNNSFQVYLPDMQAPAVERLRLETAMRQALERNEFVLYYQPQVDLTTGAITGIEALLRWHHPQLGLMAPGQFIWLAEETGLIVPIGEWVLRTACAQAQAWRDKGLGGMRMVVNLSARQFRQSNLVSMVADALEAARLEPAALSLEITEGTVLESTRSNHDTLADLKKMGIGISIDDFGTGYSSLSYLKRIPADTLKLDRSFVKDIAHNPEDAAIARAIIALAHGLSLTIVAEGVETREQLSALRREGCRHIQGYLLGRPMPSRRFEALARRGVDIPA
ncbi:MAG: EAL domain-containing protein [Nitrospirae bacterium]|nr:EAL domain-containing protein [Nitrospirota bacterium]